MTKLDYFGAVLAVTLLGAIGVMLAFTGSMRFYAQAYGIAGTFLMWVLLTIKRRRAP